MTLLGVVIRPLTQDEAVAHQARIESLVSTIGGACNHETGELINSPMFQSLRWETSLAAWNGEDIVGLALACWHPAIDANSKVQGDDYRYEHDSFNLDHLVVDAEFQKQRIGHQLVRKWMELTANLTRRVGERTVHWSLETDGSERTAYVRKFYESFGFAVVGYRTYGDFRDPVYWQTRTF